MNYPLACVTVLLVFAPLAARGADRPVPDTVTLLESVIAANTQLGAVTMTITNVQVRPDRPDLTMRSTVQWNDATHYRVTTNGGGQTMVGVANGSTRILYTSADNTYERNGRSFELAAPPLQGMLDRMKPALADPKSRGDFAKGVVTLTTVEGKPVYRIFVHPRANDKSAYMAMLVDRANLLVRKFVLQVNKSRSDTLLVTYKKEVRPFPADTFVFTPPAGAREITGQANGS